MSIQDSSDADYYKSIIKLYLPGLKSSFEEFHEKMETLKNLSETEHERLERKFDELVAIIQQTYGMDHESVLNYNENDPKNDIDYLAGVCDLIIIFVDGKLENDGDYYEDSEEYEFVSELNADLDDIKFTGITDLNDEISKSISQVQAQPKQKPLSQVQAQPKHLPTSISNRSSPKPSISNRSNQTLDSLAASAIRYLKASKGPSNKN